MAVEVIEREPLSKHEARLEVQKQRLECGLDVITFELLRELYDAHGEALGYVLGLREEEG